MEDELDSKKDQDAEGSRKTFPIIRKCDIPEETKIEIVELISTTINANFNEATRETACKTIKEQMDKIYGPNWNVIVGEAFGFDVTHLHKHILWLFIMGNLGVLVWKSG